MRAEKAELAEKNRQVEFFRNNLPSEQKKSDTQKSSQKTEVNTLNLDGDIVEAEVQKNIQDYQKHMQDPAVQDRIKYKQENLLPPKGKKKKKKRSGLRGSANGSMLGLNTEVSDQSMSPSPDARNPFMKATTQVAQ